MSARCWAFFVFCCVICLIVVFSGACLAFLVKMVLNACAFLWRVYLFGPLGIVGRLCSLPRNLLRYYDYITALLCVNSLHISESFALFSSFCAFIGSHLLRIYLPSPRLVFSVI